MPTFFYRAYKSITNINKNIVGAVNIANKLKQKLTNDEIERP